MMNASLFLVKRNVGYEHDSKDKTYGADVALWAKYIEIMLSMKH